MKKIFLTGGTGFIGKHVLSKLVQTGMYEITVLSRKHREPHDGVSYVQGDLVDKYLIKEAISQADYVIHLAGCKNDPGALFTTNVAGTENIIAACNNDRVSRLIYLSSVGVIGPSSDTTITERTACQPENDYEKSKYQAELLVRHFSMRKPGITIILRPTNVFGEDDPELHLLNLINKIKCHRFYYVGNDRSTYYLNYLYVKEISELIAALIPVRSQNDLYILNTPTPLTDFVSVIKEIIQDEKPIKGLPYLPIQFLAKCFDLIPRDILKHPPINSQKLTELTNKRRYSSALLMEDLKWKPFFTIKHALGNLIAHYCEKNILI